MENQINYPSETVGKTDEGLISARKEIFLDTDVLELPTGVPKSHYNTKAGTPPIMEKQKQSFNKHPLDNNISPCNLSNAKSYAKGEATIVTDELQEFQETIAEIDRLEAVFDERHFVENVDKQYDLLVNNEPEILNGYDEKRFTDKVMPLICQVE